MMLLQPTRGLVCPYLKEYQRFYKNAGYYNGTVIENDAKELCITDRRTEIIDLIKKVEIVFVKINDYKDFLIRGKFTGYLTIK